jgi:hypothetical protein
MSDLSNGGNLLKRFLDARIAISCYRVVDDIPADVSALGFKAPLHALIAGHEGERDRRIEPARY